MDLGYLQTYSYIVFYHEYPAPSCEQNFNFFINEFYSYKKFYSQFKGSYILDVEHFRHNPNLYATWAEKVIFLKLSAIKNYFNSTCFYWVDAGNFRNREINKYYINWPSSRKCFEDGRVVINEKLNVSN